MNRIVLLILFTSILYSQYSFGYDYFSINKPNSTSWNVNGKGTIKNTQISVFPRGIYAEVSITFEVSAEGANGIQAGDTLEAVIDFSLPQKSLVIDSWLWIDDTTIVQAKHLDRWTATNIYENIVRRVRRDPSLLTKSYWGDNYNIKIYPLMYTTPRKAKITYLVPLENNGDYGFAPLPVNIVNLSKTIGNISLKLFENDSDYTNPVVDNGVGLSYTEGTENSLKFFATTLSGGATAFAATKIKYNSNYPNKISFSQYPLKDSENEGYYEVSFKINDFLKMPKTKRLCVVVDYDSIYSSLTATELKQSVTEYLKTYLDSTDYFNVVFGGKTIKKHSEDWVLAKKSNIETAFSTESNYKSDTTGQEKLLNTVVDFVNAKDSSARIMLITSNIKRYKADTALKISDRVVKRMNNKTAIDIFDHYVFYYLSSTGGNFVAYNPYTVINGNWYYGNELFYTDLCKKTGGNYYEIRNYSYYYYYSYYSIKSSFDYYLTQNSQYIDGTFSAFDFQVSSNEGFTYGRYMVKNVDLTKVSPSAEISMVGKYSGKLPLKVQVSGIHRGKTYARSYSFDATTANNEGSIVERHWWGQYILQNEISYQNQTISEVVDAAIKYRILCRQTAFLCLEPSLGGEVCKDCVDGVPLTQENQYPFTDGLASSTTEENVENVVKAYPNPATEKVTFEFSNTKNETVVIQIFSSTGQLIKTITVDPKDTKVEWLLTFENGERVPRGLYLAVITIGKKSQTLKIQVE